MQGIGYKETVRYIRGHCTFEEMTEAVRVATRHYAKRQLTWLKGRAPDAVWLDANSRPARELAEAIAEYHI